MIRDYLLSEFTREDLDKRNELVRKQQAIYDEAALAIDDPKKQQETAQRNGAELQRITRELYLLTETVSNRYIDALKQDPETALDHIRNILADYSKQDLLNQMDFVKRDVLPYIKSLDDKLKSDDISPQERRSLKTERNRAAKIQRDHCTKNYDCAFFWLNALCDKELKAIFDNVEASCKAVSMIQEKAASLYKPRSGVAKTPASQTGKDYLHGVQLSLFDKLYLPMSRSASTDALMAADPRFLDPDPFSDGAALLHMPDTKGISNHTIIFYDIGKYSTKKGELLGVPALKLVDAAQAVMTANNPHRPDDLSRINPTVVIDTKEYARANGVRIDAEKKETPEEQRRENDAVKGNLRVFLSTIKKASQQLYDIGQEWEEIDESGHTVRYRAHRMVSSVDVDASYIKLNFDADVARSIMCGHMSQYPTALLSLDGRKPVPYRLGRKLAIQNSMVNNRARGTANTLSVAKALEAVPQIPSYESIVSRGQRNWKDKIKKPLEAALDDLRDAYFLRSWNYRSRVLGNLTPEAAERCKWEEYKNLYIDFELADESTTPSQLAAKGAEIKELYSGKKKRSTKRKS